MVMIGTALMLPKGSLFSCYEILELIGDDVYADIYDDEVYAIDYLFDLYFEKDVNYIICTKLLQKIMLKHS